MENTLRDLMKAIEQRPDTSPATDPLLLAAALAGLGSKYLAVGSPTTLGLIACGPQSDALIACHTLLFGTMDLQRSEQVGIEEAMAADIVCLPSNIDIELTWIADATHINVLSEPNWSPSMLQLATTCSLTLSTPISELTGTKHGLLIDVIQGVVSGRMGEEITALVCMACVS